MVVWVFPNFRLMNLALRCRWAWLQRVDPSRSWAKFNLQIPRLARAVFDSATHYELCNGEKARFWMDRWLNGAKVCDLAPNLVAKVAAQSVKSRTVKDGLAGAWLLDCGPDLGEVALAEFFNLWRTLANVVLDPDKEDEFVWRWSREGVYTARSAYQTFFAGMTMASASTQIWRSRAPYSCKFFAWLVEKNRCWTADRLRRRGLAHQAACPLCDQEQETLSHLLLGCVVSREVWAWALQRWGKMDWMPTPDDDLIQWWTSRTCPPAGLVDGHHIGVLVHMAS